VKRVLVFGGSTGEIAARVANMLADGGSLEPVFVDMAAPMPIASKVQHTPIAIDDATQLSQTLQTVDAVVSCVENNPRLIIASANALFAAQKSHPAKRVVLLSSMAVYGDAEGWVDEHSHINATDAYSAARIQAETLAATSENAICLRAGVEYGPGSPRWSGLIGRLLRARRLGDLGAAGDGCCNLLYVDDLIQAILKALKLETAGNQVFNICSSERVTWNEYFIRYACALGAVPAKRVGVRRLKMDTKLSIPLKVVEKAIGSKWTQRLHVPAPLTSSMLGIFGQRLVLKVDKAEQVLGMKWTPLQDGLKTAAQWISHKQ